MNRSKTRASASHVQAAADRSTAQQSKTHSTFTDGQITWVTIDGLPVPCVIREGKPHGPVRVVENKLLNRLSSIAAVNAAFQNRQLLVSKYLTGFEALQLNSAARSQFGDFTNNDLVVDIDEFRELYEYVKTILRNSTTAVTGGWIQINNR